MKYLRAMLMERQTGGKTYSEANESNELSSTTDNLFDILINANESETPETGLSEEEVIGNSFIFMFAGHETTAHALAFALGLLALYPEVQDEVYAHIKGVIGDRKAMDYSDLNQLKLVTGVFLEALRFYPPVTQTQKIAQEDTVLSVARHGDEQNRETLFIPAGAAVYFAIIPMHHHPTYWPEPERFRPSRFTEEYNKDAFLPFSVGHRSCIGRRFAETEATVALAMFLARYEVLIDTERFPTIPRENAQARQARLLNPSHFATLAPANLALIFKRR
ncbi:cytochrome P450 family protein [Ceratobasidium sp. AG-Ba]|nr:cytochrome P450 family protein [Ceratobasidium sp. AG-Ba]